MGGYRIHSPPGTLINRANSWLYLKIPGAGGGAAAPYEGEVIKGNARLQVHLQTVQIQGCSLIFQVPVVVLLLQIKESSLQDTLASRYTHKQFRALP
jgi:hypothetical protein